MGSANEIYTPRPNNIVMEGLVNYNNTFGNECYNLRFANNTIGNVFDGFIWDCSFGTTTVYNNFRQYITGSIFPAKLGNSNIGAYCWYINVSGTTNNIYCNILTGTRGASTSNRLNISITESYQFAGLNSSGTLKKWIPADLID